MTEARDSLEPVLVERVLQRLGSSGPPTLDHSGLCSVYEAWCRRVPFDNVRKRIAVHTRSPGPLPGDEPAEFFEAWLDHGVGGTCWAGNGALHALLASLGYRACRGVATMMVAPGIPPNHGTVVVDLEDGRYIVDASILHVEPLRVAAGEETSVGNAAWGALGHWLGASYAIRWRASHRVDRLDCRIDEWSVDAQRFRLQHEATREWSPFNFELTANLVRGAGRVGIVGGQAFRVAGDGRFELEDLSDRVGFLVDQLGMSEEIARAVPEDVPTPPPPGTRTAARLAETA